MKFSIHDMESGDARIIATWRYPDPYSFYDMESDRDDLEEFLDFQDWDEDSNFAVLNVEGELVGFFTFTWNDDTLILGLGLRPDMTGAGLGVLFVRTGLEYARVKFSPKELRLSVATFNKRAIRVYEKCGFKVSRTFMNSTNGGVYEFVEMILDAHTER